MQSITYHTIGCVLLSDSQLYYFLFLTTLLTPIITYALFFLHQKTLFIVNYFVSLWLFGHFLKKLRLYVINDANEKSKNVQK